MVAATHGARAPRQANPSRADGSDPLALRAYQGGRGRRPSGDARRHPSRARRGTGPPARRRGLERERALARAHATAPDVVLVDFHLSGEDGLLLCHRIKRMTLAPRVVINSAYADESLVAPAMIAQADALLAKHATSAVLCETLREVVSEGRPAPELAPRAARAPGRAARPGRGGARRSPAAPDADGRIMRATGLPKRSSSSGSRRCCGGSARRMGSRSDRPPQQRGVELDRGPVAGRWTGTRSSRPACEPALPSTAARSWRPWLHRWQSTAIVDDGDMQPPGLRAEVHRDARGRGMARPR